MMNKLSFAALRASAARQWARVTLTLSLLVRATGGALGAFYAGFVEWLDRRFFAWTVKYATHPLVIFATMLLLIPLIVFASITSLALILGNYTNVCSAAVSSIVLMQSMKHHRENKALHAENAQLHTLHAETIAALHVKVDALTTAATPVMSAAPAMPVSGKLRQRPRHTRAVGESEATT